MVSLGGAAAIAAKFNDISGSIEAGHAITLGHMQPFHTFAWLMADEQAAQHSKWCNDIHKRGTGAPTAVEPRAVAKRTAPKSAGGLRNQKIVQESTMALFKKKRTT